MRYRELPREVMRERPSIVKDLARVNLSLLNTTSHYSVLNNQSSDSINTINSNLDTTGDLVSFHLQEEEEEEAGGLTKSDSAFTWQSKRCLKYFLILSEIFSRLHLQLPGQHALLPAEGRGGRDGGRGEQLRLRQLRGRSDVPEQPFLHRPHHPLYIRRRPQQPGLQVLLRGPAQYSQSRNFLNPSEGSVFPVYLTMRSSVERDISCQRILSLAAGSGDEGEGRRTETAQEEAQERDPHQLCVLQHQV